MITEIVYTETYKITLTLLVDNVAMGFGASSAEKLLDRIDRIVEKIIRNPYLYQAVPVDSRYRRAVISGQSSFSLRGNGNKDHPFIYF